MQFYKFFQIPLFLAFAGFFFYSCDSLPGQQKFLNSEMYDFAKPKVLDLTPELDEISGLAYYAKDTSIFAIIDEDGILYKVSLKNPKAVTKWKFDKKRDFEELVLIDSTFYVLVSNGDIVKINFLGDSLVTSKSDFGKNKKSANEFETLYHDKSNNQLVLVCKDCEQDKKNSISRYAYNYLDSMPDYSPITPLDMEPVEEKLGVSKHLKASAGAIHPVNGDLYLVSAIQQLIVIFSPDGTFKNLYKLNPGIYKQPEGIAFTPEGNLIISNEFAEMGFGNLLLMKNKLNDKKPSTKKTSTKKQ